MALGFPSLRIIKHDCGFGAASVVSLAIQDTDLTLVSEEQIQALLSGEEALPTTGRFVAVVENVVSPVLGVKQPVEELAELLEKRGFCIARETVKG